MYRIAELAGQDEAGKNYADQIARFGQKKGLFPQIECYLSQEQFFENVPETMPTSAVIALPGVAGLNAVEHLRSICPGCGIIWCSDLDFSLHAFRLRADYFLLEPVTEAALRQGFRIWLDGKKSGGAALV